VVGNNTCLSTEEQIDTVGEQVQTNKQVRSMLARGKNMKKVKRKRVKMEMDKRKEDN
jgi:hypothetical protein